MCLNSCMRIAVGVPDETPASGIANCLEFEHMSFAKVTNTLMYQCATVLGWQLMNPWHSEAARVSRVMEESF